VGGVGALAYWCYNALTNINVYILVYTVKKTNITDTKRINMATKIITIANQKGGVGKTTTAVTLAHGLALKGKNVLLVDFDPQGQVAKFLGVNSGAGAHTLLVIEPDSHEALAYLRSQIKVSNRDRLWVLPGNKKTMDAQIQIEKSPIDYIRNSLDPFMRKSLEYIVIDTSPSIGGLQERAIWAADLLIIPTAPEYASLEGVSQLYKDVLVLFEEREWEGKLLGVLPTFYDEQTRMSKDSIDSLKETFRSSMLTPIHRATILRDCTAEGLTIFEKAPSSRAAEEYWDLVNAVLGSQ
jgi:chromosome partitioning protein